MRVKQKTLTTLLLENKAPKYRPFLGFFLAGVPLLFLAYLVSFQRAYLDCIRLGTKRIDCKYVQEYNFPVSSRENFSLTHIKATAVYQEVFISVEQKKTVNNTVLLVGRNNYLYIENFRDVQSASDFKTRFESFVNRYQNRAIIAKTPLDTLSAMLEQNDNYRYYLWGMLCLLSGLLLLYDASYWESYVFNQGNATLTRRRQHLIFRSKSDYLLERIVEAKVEDYKGFLWSNYWRIILTLANGKKIILNSRLLESISNGKREEKILAMIAEKLNLTQEEVLI
ncbi:YcxB-like protein domain-containing protein [Microcystis aeruginosa]